MWDRIRRIARTLDREIRVCRIVLADPRTPRVAKLLLAGAVLYAVSPVDVIPDFIPVVGHFDDFVIVPALILLAFYFVPGALIAEARQQAAA